MHLTPIQVFVTCDRCGCRMTVSPQQHPRQFICADCRDQEYIERKHIRSSYDPGDYHMIHDPDGSWSPTGKTYLNRKDIEVYIRCGVVIPGTRFECRGNAYIVTKDCRLIKQGNIESNDTEGTWQHTTGNAHDVGRSTD